MSYDSNGLSLSNSHAGQVPPLTGKVDKSSSVVMPKDHQQTPKTIEKENQVDVAGTQVLVTPKDTVKMEPQSLKRRGSMLPPANAGEVYEAVVVDRELPKSEEDAEPPLPESPLPLPSFASPTSRSLEAFRKANQEEGRSYLEEYWEKRHQANPRQVVVRAHAIEEDRETPSRPVERPSKLTTEKPSKSEESEKVKGISSGFVNAARNLKELFRKKTVEDKFLKNLNEINNISKKQVDLLCYYHGIEFRHHRVTHKEIPFAELDVDQQEKQKAKIEKKFHELELKKQQKHTKLTNRLNDLKRKNPEKYAQLYANNQVRLSICEANERIFGQEVCNDRANEVLRNLKSIQQIQELSAEEAQNYFNYLGGLAAKVRDDCTLWGTRTNQPAFVIEKEIVRVKAYMLSKGFVVYVLTKPLSMVITEEEMAHAAKIREKLEENLDKAMEKMRSDTSSNLGPDQMEYISDQTALDFYVISSQLQSDYDELKPLTNLTRIKEIESNLNSRKRALDAKIKEIEEKIMQGNVDKINIQQEIEGLDREYEEILEAWENHLNLLNIAMGDTVILTQEIALLKQNEPISLPKERVFENKGKTSLKEEIRNRFIEGKVLKASGLMEHPSSEKEEGPEAYKMPPKVHPELLALKRLADEKNLYIPPPPPEEPTPPLPL